MFRSRGENLRSIYILLFLNVAFFFLEYQDPRKFAALFAFDGPSVLSGEAWRLFTYQFTQGGQGWFVFPRPLVLFFTLLLLYMMGSAVEEEWGTFHFLTFFIISTLGSAAAAGYLGIPLLGSYFVNFSLLFVYASTFPQQTFYLLGSMPVRIRWIAYAALLLLLAGVAAGGASNAAALAGAFAGYVYYLSQRIRIVFRDEETEEEEAAGAADHNSIRNAARFVAIKRAINARKATDIDRLVAQAERDLVKGVNICAPTDFKPESLDGYCIRCDGFSECSARFMLMNRPPPELPEGPAVPERTA